ncbi:MAG: hypothetical protein EXS36_01375 [Pedosphaera sp.]|nr:hypothetical protein [Pedosphaera sp.]
MGIEPLLDFSRTGRGFRIYGYAAETIELEIRNELASTQWVPWRTITIGNEYEDISAADVIITGDSRFIRGIRRQ